EAAVEEGDAVAEVDDLGHQLDIAGVGEEEGPHQAREGERPPHAAGAVARVRPLDGGGEAAAQEAEGVAVRAAGAGGGAPGRAAGAPRRPHAAADDVESVLIDAA